VDKAKRTGPVEPNVPMDELVVPNEEVFHASKTMRPDLSWGAASASNTVDIATLLEV
jgi:hypothetical protein